MNDPSQTNDCIDAALADVGKPRRLPHVEPRRSWWRPSTWFRRGDPVSTRPCRRNGMVVVPHGWIVGPDAIWPPAGRPDLAPFPLAEGEMVMAPKGYTYSADRIVASVLAEMELDARAESEILRGVVRLAIDGVAEKPPPGLQGLAAWSGRACAAIAASRESKYRRQLDVEASASRIDAIRTALQRSDQLIEDICRALGISEQLRRTPRWEDRCRIIMGTLTLVIRAANGHCVMCGAGRLDAKLDLTDAARAATIAAADTAQPSVDRLEPLRSRNPLMPSAGEPNRPTADTPRPTFADHAPTPHPSREADFSAPRPEITSPEGDA